MIPSLTFQFNLPPTPVQKLLEGKLILTTPEGKNIAFLATSGLPGYQYMGAWKIKGKGCLPPSSKVGFYSVSTQELWMPGVKGVEGGFFAIAPFSVECDGICRGDFGIHFDANMPGSAGCVVIAKQVQAHWDLFRKYMDEFAKKRIKSLPLEVNYPALTAKRYSVGF